MNTYNVIIDDTMIRNMMQTDMKESMDLLSVKQVLYFVFFGLIPAYVVYHVPVQYRAFKAELIAKFKQILLLLLIIAIAVFSFYKHYSSFVREHKPLRFTANPSYWLYSVGYYINATLTSGPVVVTPIGEDAKVVKDTNTPSKLVILVVGEATRADHFALNGYHRETTPQLKKEEILNFSNVYSCGTSTAVSVPCMFSYYDKSHYSYKKGIQTENVLDVLNHTDDISILWRDNNSNSKGVALRVTYQDYKKSENNSICTEDECRDEGMLVGLEEYIAAQKGKDILIVLHQMGNHGPAYYKRYPKSFEKFTPVCKTNQLEECTKEEINNAYDNAILYTDDFLVKTITLLKKYKSTHQTAMIYMSDHGESLGEKGIYLHGLPYFMAPSAQTHIPALIWLNDSLKDKLNVSALDTSKRWSQDNLFHSLLGLFNVETKVYDEKLDIFKGKTKE
jgi:lipid A ethanolaminephosphotransferase